MAITHIVLFQFKSDVTTEVINDVHFSNLDHISFENANEFTKISAHMLSLKDTCLHPSSQKPYIKTSSGGIDNSPEGAQVGLFTVIDSET